MSISHTRRGRCVRSQARFRHFYECGMSRPPIGSTTSLPIPETVRARIMKRYRREAAVIHPPVDADAFSPGTGARSFYLAVSALVPYKRLDILMQALGDRPLVIVGDGPERERLQALAGANVEFRGSLSSDALAKAYRRARALIFPGEEDFGITPLEAMASGTPVIASAVAARPRQSFRWRNPTPPDLFFDEQTAACLRAAVERFEDHENELRSRRWRAPGCAPLRDRASNAS